MQGPNGLGVRELQKGWEADFKVHVLGQVCENREGLQEQLSSSPHMQGFSLHVFSFYLRYSQFPMVHQFLAHSARPQSHIHTHILIFIFSFTIGDYRLLNIVPCALRKKCCLFYI